MNGSEFVAEIDIMLVDVIIHFKLPPAFSTIFVIFEALYIFNLAVWSKVMELLMYVCIISHKFTSIQV